MATLETAARNAAADALAALADGGTLVLETSGDAEVSTHAFAGTAFGAASGGVATAAAIGDDTSAAGGTIAQASIYTSGAAKVMELTASATGGGGEVQVSSLTITAGETVSISSLTITVPAS